MTLLPKKSLWIGVIAPLAVLMVPPAVLTAVGAAHADSPISVHTPDTLSGRPMVTDSSVTGDIAQQKAQLQKSVPNVGSTAVAIYGTRQAGNVVGVHALAAPITDPLGQLTEGLNDMGRDGMDPLSGIEQVAPGPMGGNARCGASGVNGKPIIVCGWADQGSLGFITWYSKTPLSNAANEFATLRGQVEHTG
jgi:hypothetical protein